jgi:hypothetical protein
MLQRMQTVWLLLAAVCGFLTFKFPFYTGNKTADQGKSFESVTATSGILLLVLSVAVICAVVISIFLYKNRKLQLRIVLASLVISVINLYLYFKETRTFSEGNYAITAIVVVAIPVLLFFAMRGINKDQKLVKSLERLR